MNPRNPKSNAFSDSTDGCIKHPAVMALTERMLNITQMAVGNAEYMQILRYELASFYRMM